MLGYLKRLVVTGAAYQFGDIVAKALALLTLPLYTRHVSPQGYGAAETLLTAVILASIVLRGGVGEAFIRFYFDDTDVERRARIARTDGTRPATVMHHIAKGYNDQQIESLAAWFAALKR